MANETIDANFITALSQISKNNNIVRVCVRT